MPRQRHQIGFDMFPFLSVLCSVIGVMMLLIMLVMSTRVIEADEQTDAEEERKRVEHAGDVDSVDDETYRRLEEEINRSTGLLATRLDARNELMRKEQQLIALIEEKKDALAIPEPQRREPIDLDRPDPVAVVPDPDHTVSKAPIFVEVSADGYLVHREGESYPPVEKVGSANDPHFQADPRFRAFLAEVDRNRDNEYLLLLLHPNGVDALEDLRGYLLQDFGETTTETRPGPIPGTILKITRREDRIGVGVEPFSRDWQLIIEQANGTE